jgi:hypothetical protein
LTAKTGATEFLMAWVGRDDHAGVGFNVGLPGDGVAGHQLAQVLAYGAVVELAVFGLHQQTFAEVGNDQAWSFFTQLGIADRFRGGALLMLLLLHPALLLLVEFAFRHEGFFG